MVSSTETDGKKGDDEATVAKNNSSSTSMERRNHITINVPTVEGGLTVQRQYRKERFLDFLRAHPSKDWLLRFGFIGRLPSSFSFLKRIGSQRSSSSDSSPSNGCQHFRVPFVRNINWEALIKYCKNWIKHPRNMALLVWFFFVAAGLLVLFLLMTGLLNGAIPKSSQKRWTEIDNQFVNALFTIMCLYQHPRLFYHLVLLCRWRSSDAAELRTVYCKNGARRPKERAHMMLVVLLLHVTCLSQYGLCGLYWGYSSETRPTWPQVLFIVLGIVSPVIAGLYVVYSPLGRKCEYEVDEESQGEAGMKEVKLSNERVIVTRAEWIGGVFDFWDDLTVGYLSFFCTFCVFGWNMERLGFGNMYVHIVTFVLLCVAPVLVFSVTALKMDDDAFRDGVGIAGIMLCFCGLLYGGFWRIRMRKRFNLPANPFCCGYPAMTDFMQWLFCWSCSRAQEVRTGNFYTIEEGSLYQKEINLQPLPREGSSGPLFKSNSSSLSNSEDEEKHASNIPNETSANHGSDDKEKSQAMQLQPPRPPLIQLANMAL